MAELSDSLALGFLKHYEHLMRYDAKYGHLKIDGVATLSETRLLGHCLTFCGKRAGAISAAVVYNVDGDNINLYEAGMEVAVRLAEHGFSIPGLPEELVKKKISLPHLTSTNKEIKGLIDNYIEMSVQQGVDLVKSLSFLNVQREKRQLGNNFAKKGMWRILSSNAVKELAGIIKNIAQKNDLSAGDAKKLMDDVKEVRLKVAEQTGDAFGTKNEEKYRIITNEYFINNPVPENDISYKLFFENYEKANGKKTKSIGQEGSISEAKYSHSEEFETISGKKFTLKLEHEYSRKKDGESFAKVSLPTVEMPQEILLEKIAEHAEKALKWDGNKVEDLVDEAAKMKWWLIQYEYFRRGTSSVADYLEKAIYEHHGLAYFPHKSGSMSRDFLALHSLRPEEYSERYISTLPRMPITEGSLKTETAAGLKGSKEWLKWCDKVHEAGKPLIHIE